MQDNLPDIPRPVASREPRTTAATVVQRSFQLEPKLYHRKYYSTPCCRPPSACRLRRTQICHSLGERALDLGELRSKGPVAGLRLVAFPAESTEATTPVESSARASTTSAWRCRDSRSRRPRVAGVGRRRGATLPSGEWRPNLLTTVFPSLYS